MNRIVTSFGGVDFKRDRQYAIMCWHLCASIYLHDGNSMKMVLGAPSGICLKMAKTIAKDFSFCEAVEAPANPDKFCSKIHAMRNALSSSKSGDIICYLDADVLNFGSINSALDVFKNSKKTILTELRKKLRDDARKFRSWVIGLQVREDTESFLNSWLKNSIKTNHKFSDQIALYQSWKEHGSGDDDCMDYREIGLSSCHFGGSKFGSKFQGTARGPFKKGHSGGMKELRKKLKMQPVI